MKGNSSKTQCYDLRAYYEYVSNIGMTLVCRGFGNTCRIGVYKDEDVIIIKPDVEIK